MFRSHCLISGHVRDFKIKATAACRRARFVVVYEQDMPPIREFLKPSFLEEVRLFIQAAWILTLPRRATWLSPRSYAVRHVEIPGPLALSFPSTASASSRSGIRRLLLWVRPVAVGHRAESPGGASMVFVKRRWAGPSVHPGLPSGFRREALRKGHHSGGGPGQ